MQKATITIYGDGSDTVNVDMSFDPPLKNDDHAPTPVEQMACSVLEYLAGDANAEDVRKRGQERLQSATGLATPVQGQNQESR